MANWKCDTCGEPITQPDHKCNMEFVKDLRWFVCKKCAYKIVRKYRRILEFIGKYNRLFEFIGELINEAY